MTDPNDAIDKPESMNSAELIAALNVAVMVVRLEYDAQGRAVDAAILEVNPLQASYWQMQQEQLIGQSIRIIPWPAQVVEQFLSDLELVAQMGTRRKVDQATWVRDRNVEVTFTPLGEDRILVTAYDISEYRGSSDQDARYRQVSKLVQEFAYAGRLNRDSGEMIYDWMTDAVDSILGVSRQELAAMGRQGVLQWVSRLVHPDDQSGVLQMVELAQAGQAAPVTEFRLLHPGGRTRWVRSYLRILDQDDADNSLQIAGLVQDITDSKQAELRYKEISEMVSEFAYAVTVDLKTGRPTYRWMTDAIHPILGYSAQEYLRLMSDPEVGIEQLFLPEDRARASESLAALMTAPVGETLSQEMRVLDRTGRTRWLRSTVRIIRRDEAAGRVEMLGAAQDITDIKQAEATYRSIFDAANDGMYVLDPQSGEIMDVNRRGSLLYGLEREKLIGRKPLFLSSAYDGEGKQQDWLDEFARAVQGQETAFETQVKDAKGNLLWVDVHLKKARIGSDEGVLAVVRDISELKKYINALVLSEERYRMVSEMVSDFALAGSWRLDTGVFKMRWMTEAITRMTGYFSSDLPSRTTGTLYDLFQQVIHPDDQGLIADVRRRLAAGENNVPVELRILRRDGQVRWVRAVFRVTSRSENGLTAGIVAVIQDITILRQAAETYQAIFNANNDGLFVYDIEADTFTDANQGGLRMFGVEKEGVLGKPLEQLTEFLPLSLEECRQVLEGAVRQADVSQEFQLRDRAGFTFWVEARFRRAKIGGRDSLLIVVRDITEHKANLLALQVSEDRYRTVTELISDLAFSFARAADDPQGDWYAEWITAGAGRILGYSAEELDEGFRGGGRSRNSRFVHPDDLQIANGSLESIESGADTDVAEFRWITKNGQTRWVRLALRGERSAPDALPHRLIGLVEDITGRKQIEQTLQRQVQRLSALRAIDLAISASLDLKITLHTFILQAMSLLEADGMEIWLYDPDRKVLDAGSKAGFRTSAVDRDYLPLGQGIAGRTALTRRIYEVSDSHSDPVLLRYPELANEGFRAYYSIPLLARGMVVGVWNIFHRHPASFSPEWVDLVAEMSIHAALAIDNAMVVERLQARQVEAGHLTDETLERLAGQVDDAAGRPGATRRRMQSAVDLAQRMGLEGDAIVNIRRGALLTAVGDFRPDALKDEAGSPAERPRFLHEYLARLPGRPAIVDIPTARYEKWDGSGRPMGLTRDQIPLAARIFAVVDAWHSALEMGMDRPDALSGVQKQSGSAFDPQVVRALMEMVEQ